MSGFGFESPLGISCWNCCGVAKLARRPLVKREMRRFESCPHSHRDVAQLVSAPALGAGGRKFESCHPDFELIGDVAQMDQERFGSNEDVAGSNPVIPSGRVAERD